MRDVFKKNTTQETAEITSNTNQELELSEKETEDTQQFANSTDDPDTLALLESLQKVNAEEQKLLEIKQSLLKTQKDLQNNLVNEIDKKKKTIANLVSEIPTLQNKCEQLGQALGIDIYNL
jgi:nanoRNase/pAp phosphatase (c-di-AMP/oligoRNAs hydrolase)